ncbi:MAG: glycosyltransferase family 39 protein [Ardenticatenaceae bacterium]|nr:glycosyltransferase family 39 protein [Ardenticatenaceae bacterium]MCB8987124.1 glycosyltransferase family 39 protein [Ardenticatenaceae bacterium]
MQTSQPTQPISNKVATTHHLSDNMLLLLIGGGVVLFHILTNGQYGFHRDELDILMNARQLAWGYVAYPPITPFLARIGLTLFGPSLIGLRAFAALGQGIVVILSGLMARDFGGGRWAQVVAAVAVAISPVALTTGTLIQYMSFDYLWWVLLAFCTVRLLRSENPHWWLGIGAAIGLGMMTKYTMLFLVAGLVVGVLITSSRRYLRSPWLWAGTAVALLIFLPNLIWQIQHQFISLDFLSAIHARDLDWGRADNYLPEQIYMTTNPFTLPLWIAGLFFCFFAPAGKRFRPLAWMYVTTFVLLLVSKGRSYYLAPAYPMLLAAGSAWLESWLKTLARQKARLLEIGVGILLVLGAIVAVLIVKPIVPLNSGMWDILSQISDLKTEMVGWPDLVQQVADIYHRLPVEEQAHTAVLAGNYGEAGALDLYGPDYDLPPVISGANSLWARGYGDPPPETVIVVGFEGTYATHLFASCQPQGRVRNQYGVKNEETNFHSMLYVCRQPRRPWPELWADMQWYQ